MFKFLLAKDFKKIIYQANNDQKINDNTFVVTSLQRTQFYCGVDSVFLAVNHQECTATCNQDMFLTPGYIPGITLVAMGCFAMKMDTNFKLHRFEFIYSMSGDLYTCSNAGSKYDTNKKYWIYDWSLKTQEQHNMDVSALMTIIDKRNYVKQMVKVLNSPKR